MQPEVTWHAMDATCATLRGFGSSDRTSEINDENLGLFLRSNLDVFEKLLGVMPEYTRRLMFSPEVASTVMATL